MDHGAYEKEARTSITWWRRVLLVCLCVLLALILIFFIAAIAVSEIVCLSAADRIATEADLVAAEMRFDYILVLGCLVRSDGTLSDRLADRVGVGVSAYHAGLGDKILMSGDSEYAAEYDEVGAMKAESVACGVVSEDVEVDPYGLSTYESLIRLRDVYQGKSVLIVTQEYHLYRALYLAERLGLEAYGISASLREYQKQPAMEFREIFARCKDVLYGFIQPEPNY